MGGDCTTIFEFADNTLVIALLVDEFPFVDIWVLGCFLSLWTYICAQLLVLLVFVWENEH